jgi:hypothetical protein
MPNILPTRQEIKEGFGEINAMPGIIVFLSGPKWRKRE